MTGIKSKVLFNAVFLLQAALFGGCQRESGDFAPSGNDVVEFIFTRADFTMTTMQESMAGTRANVAGDGSGKFEEDDRIGLYVGDGPARHYVLTLRGGEWMPRLSRQELGGGLVTLNAYYPAGEETPAAADSHPHTLPTDQQDEDYNNADLLWVNRTVNMETLGGNRISLAFSHAMHRLVVNLRNTDGSDLPADTKVSVCSPTQGSVVLFDGKVSTAGNSVAEWITARPLGDGRYCAIVFPRQLRQGEAWVKIASGGKEAVYRMPGKVGGSSSLEAGKQTTLNLTPKQNGTVEPAPEPDAEWANRKVWVYGIDDPVYPDDESQVPIANGNVAGMPGRVWFRMYPDSREAYMNWNGQCDWYDCDKRNPHGDQNDIPDDSKICWAASAANLLHWWMNLNKEYIDAYDRKFGTGQNPEYPRPSMVFDGSPAADGAQESAIFDFFRKNCRNDGAGSDQGVNWLISNVQSVPIPQGSDIYEKFHGYFTEVFPADRPVAGRQYFNSKKTFNDLLKEMLDKNQGIGINCYMVADKGPHAMVLWGAEFDEEGYASYIYYTDSNDYYDQGNATATFQRHRCIRRQVTYYDDITASVKLGVNPINSLVPVDLGRDRWSAAFPDVKPKN